MSFLKKVVSEILQEAESDMIGMSNILYYGMTALEMVRQFPTSFYRGYKNRRLFKDVDTYFMFIGYIRSGHSLVGALLDALPNIVCGHELGVLKYVYAGYSRTQNYYLLLENSRRFAQEGRKWRCGCPGGVL